MAPGLRAEPYPLASNTVRALKGFLPTLPEKIGITPMTSPAQTIGSQQLLETTGERLRNDLAEFDLELGDPVFLRLFKEEREIEMWELRIAGVKDRQELERRLRWVKSDLIAIEGNRVIELDEVGVTHSAVASVY